MDRITQKSPASDFLGAILQKTRAKGQGGEDFQALLENAVSNRKRPEQKSSVERPETESPEQKIHRKQRNEQAAKTDAAEAQQPDENAQLAQAAAVQQPAAADRPTAAQATVQAMSTQAMVEAPQAANPMPEVPAVNSEIAPAQTAIPAVTAQQEQETIIIGDPAQQKFDSMVQKAAQELETAKQPTEPTESTGQTELAETPKPADAVEETPEIEQPAEQPVDELEDPQQKLPDETTQPRAVVQQPARPQVSEQRQLGELPDEDRAVLELVRPESAAPAPQPEQRIEPEIPRPADVRTDAAPQPIRMPDQTERIHTEIVRSLAQERTEFTMRLEPETLGKIDVRMILEGGRLAVEITAASQKTAEMLQRQTEGLAASLRLGNVEVQSIQVTASQQASSHMDGQFGLESGHNRGAQQENNSGGHNRSGAQQDHEGNTADNARSEPEKLMDYAI